MRSLLLVAAAAALGATAVYCYSVAGRRRESTGEPVSDSHLAHAVKARVAALVTFPELVEVSTGDGTVRLAGPVIRSEMQRLLLGVRDVPGVRMVYNALSPYESSAGMARIKARPVRDGASA